jgi:hypothetical protein
MRLRTFGGLARACLAVVPLFAAEAACGQSGRVSAGDGDGGGSAGRADAATVDPRLLDVWYFCPATNAPRFSEIALCRGGRARLWTSLSGSGLPDQVVPLEGTFAAVTAQRVVASFDPRADASTQTVELEYDASLDSLREVRSTPPLGGLGPSVRLSTLPSFQPRLVCP